MRQAGYRRARSPLIFAVKKRLLAGFARIRTPWIWYSERSIGFTVTRKTTMSLIVCKFGGTSVASPERIQMVAKKLIAKRQDGHDVVAVVSAMGKTTTSWWAWRARSTTTRPRARWTGCCPPASRCRRAAGHGHRGARLGHELHGPPGRIETDGTHAKAKIVKVHNERIMEAVNKGMIAVVAGFRVSMRTGTSPRSAAGARTRRPWRWPGASAPTCADLFRRGRRVHGRSAHLPARQEAGRHQLRRHAGAVRIWRRRAADARRGVRAQIQRGH